ncbi:uncharacterized protein LOC110655618 isoform X2 [Hevea brasiliensis]|uniref:uncharacterized protein LOC110655618 isoform X1 n=1 Tax=Hevea brasiliensis TaxID=3981 RepID=UPI0025F1A7AD|nr:uncharacterized protein LOC110655618 isoform X1 [Hevea brasiliensis]XP_058006485.1 uncharacterized protein LOC110655618 isoform X1 [Hevea brasiliensis]XP_058006486.1 uncharacterized protein LOC110655618 isoform X2 [Hevea brasiliensis]
MYPRVRVRKQEQDDEAEISPLEVNGDLHFLKVLESLSVQGRTEKENQSDSPALIARITKPYVPNPKAEAVCASKEKNKAHSISRPRAVLSSPANDGMVGNRNKVNNERSLALRKCNSEPRKPIQTKAIASGFCQAKAESSLNMRRGSFKVASSSTSSVKKRGLSVSTKLLLQKPS